MKKLNPSYSTLPHSQYREDWTAFVLMVVFIMIGIYKITNPKGKIYIGQSIDIEKRFKTYKKYSCKTQKKLYNSLKKYKSINHKFEILIQCECEQLNELEVYYIELYQCFNSKYGLNLLSGGKNGCHSDESKKKMSDIHKRIGTRPPNQKGHKYNIGFKHTEETKRNMSLAKLGKPSKLLGKKLTDEHKLKISIAHKGKKRSEELNLRMSLGRIGMKYKKKTTNL